MHGGFPLPCLSTRGYIYIIYRCPKWPSIQMASACRCLVSRTSTKFQLWRLGLKSAMLRPNSEHWRSVKCKIVHVGKRMFEELSRQYWQSLYNNGGIKTFMFTVTGSKRASSSGRITHWFEWGGLFPLSTSIWDGLKPSTRYSIANDILVFVGFINPDNHTADIIAPLSVLHVTLGLVSRYFSSPFQCSLWSVSGDSRHTGQWPALAVWCGLMLMFPSFLEGWTAEPLRPGSLCILGCDGIWDISQQQSEGVGERKDGDLTWIKWEYNGGM